MSGQSGLADSGYWCQGGLGLKRQVTGPRKQGRIYPSKSLLFNRNLGSIERFVDSFTSLGLIA